MKAYAVKFAQKLELGLRITAKLFLLLPILLAMVWFNFRVDRSGLFREEEFSQTLATALLAGYNLTGYEQMDERQLLKDYVAELTEETRPATIAMGSSRILQLGQDIVGAESFFNCGMTSADFHDLLGTYYLFEQAGMLPDNIILSLDAWLLNPSPDAYTHYSDTDLYLEFLAVLQGEEWAEAEEEEPQPAHFQHVEALLSPSYFQGSFTYWWQHRNDVEEEIDLDDEIAQNAPVVRGDLYNQTTEVKMFDGSVLYMPSFRLAEEDEVGSRARAEAGTLSARHGFTALDAELQSTFELFIAHVQAQGVNVIFVLVPYNPIVYDHASENQAEFAGFFAAQEYYIDYALQNNIPVYGTYNPHVAEVQESDFYDGLHIKAEALATIVPEIRQIITAQRSGRAASPWLLSDNALISYETAERLVLERYAIEEPEELRQGEDEEIYGQLSYILERYASDAQNATRLARYAVTQDEAIIYRYDTILGGWVIDSQV